MDNKHKPAGTVGERLFFGKIPLAIFTALSALGLLLSYCVRYGYVYVDAVLFDHASFAFYVFSIFTTVFLFAMLCLKLKGKQAAFKKPVKAAVLLGELAGVLLVVYAAVVLITDRGMSLATAGYLGKKALPVWSAAVFGAFFIFLFPYLQNGKLKKAVSVVSACALAFVTYASLFPVTPYSFTAGPVVFDNGNGGYSIVFATNDKGTGYVEYTFDGKEIRVYDENNGRKNGQSIIHTVTVDKSQLSGNTYKVGSTRVLDELSYGGRTGKTIESEEYRFSDSFGESINLLAVSDWHTLNQKAEQAVKNIGEDYQAVALLGDCAPGLMSEQDIADYILDFGYALTKGSMPVIYTRGNHETRGREATKLAGYLGIEQFYYETKLGDYNLIVLDSCEDKEDSHPEYGGMGDYRRYRTEMVEWLETLENGDNAKTIVFSHAQEICIEEELSASAKNKLASLNASLLVSGHEHIFCFDDSGVFPVLVDGGVDANGKGTFVASMITLSPDFVGLVSVDNHGERVVNETVEWKNR